MMVWLLPSMPTPERVAPSATVSLPVPRRPALAELLLRLTVPADMVAAPVKLLLAVRVIVPVPTFSNWVPVPVMVPSKVKSVSSAPTFQVLLPAVELLSKVQPPPSVPLPVSSPMVYTLPVFCTMMPAGMSMVPLASPDEVLRVKRPSALLVAWGTRVPVNAEVLSCSGVRVATQPLPFSVAQ